jgi:hypothetical protein
MTGEESKLGQSWCPSANTLPSMSSDNAFTVVVASVQDSRLMSYCVVHRPGWDP